MSEWQHVYEVFAEIEKESESSGKLIEGLVDRVSALEEIMLQSPGVKVSRDGRIIRVIRGGSASNPLDASVKEAPVPENDPRKSAPGKRP